MNKIVHLSLTKKDVPIRIDVVQYATIPSIVFVLDDYTPSVGATASLYIKKPDGTEIYNACTIEDNLVTYEPTTQSFAALGVNKCQLQIIESGETGVSFLIYADVTENIIDSSAIESQDEFTALEEALSTVSDYDGRITQNTNRLDNLGDEHVTFEEAQTDTTISDNLTLSTIFGRIKHLFTRTKTLEDTNENILGLDNKRNWIELETGQDLNSIYDIGVYYCGDNTSSTLLNTPRLNVGSGFVLTVSSASSYAPLAQEIKYVTKTSAAQTYRRTCYSNREWGPWTSTGDYYTGTQITTTVPAGGATNVMSLTLPAGTYVITATMQWVEAFTNPYYLEITGLGGENINGNPIVRSTGTNGGGSVATVVVRISSQKTIYSSLSQSSGSTKTVNRLNLNAVRII